jgi:hypothetical protein
MQKRFIGTEKIKKYFSRRVPLRVASKENLAQKSALYSGSFWNYNVRNDSGER